MCQKHQMGLQGGEASPRCVQFARTPRNKSVAFHSESVRPSGGEVHRQGKLTLLGGRDKVGWDSGNIFVEGSPFHFGCDHRIDRVVFCEDSCRRAAFDVSSKAEKLARHGRA